MSDLLAHINSYYHNHGKYPKVIVSLRFYDDNFEALKELTADGVPIEIEEPQDWRLE